MRIPFIKDSFNIEYKIDSLELVLLRS